MGCHAKVPGDSLPVNAPHALQLCSEQSSTLIPFNHSIMQERIKELTDKFSAELDTDRQKFELLLQEKNEQELEYEDKLKQVRGLGSTLHCKAALHPAPASTGLLVSGQWPDHAADCCQTDNRQGLLVTVGTQKGLCA